MKIFRYAIVSLLICLFLAIGCRGGSLKSEQQPLTNINTQTEQSKDDATSNRTNIQQKLPNKNDRNETSKDNPINNQQQPAPRNDRNEAPKSNPVNDQGNSQDSRLKDPLVLEDNPTKKKHVQIFSNSKNWTEIIYHLKSDKSNKHISITFPYATTDNFVKTKLYSCSRCFLRPDVAKALYKAHEQLQEQEYGLRLFDCYRPHKVQYKMWEIKPDERYVGNPKKGSDHNRGIAVDLTIIDRNGNPLDMGTPFDDFSSKAHHTYRKLSPTVIKNRLLLKNTMASVGFHHVDTEWWHYAWNGKKPNIVEDEWNCPDKKSEQPDLIKSVRKVE
jgi:zinc D-Ala-D-Ala dipeptidase